MSFVQELGRKFARLTTNQVVRRPTMWRWFRPVMRAYFDRVAPVWDEMRLADSFKPLEVALATVDAPRRALDLGTGTGSAAFAVARRFPNAEVVGVDIAGEMISEARRKTPLELADRVRFERVDAERLPYPDESFDLVTLANMIPFFDELDRVLAPGGGLVFAFSGGPETPIYVPFDRLRGELGQRGFTDFAEFAAGRGNSLVARKPAPE